MLGRAIQLGLPRRVVVHFLLFAVASLAWVGVSLWFVANWQLKSELDGDVLRAMDLGVRQARLAMVSQDSHALQTLVERLRQENRWRFCTVVSPDRLYLAHSQPELVGDPAGIHYGDTVVRREAKRTRIPQDDGTALLRYESEMTMGERPLGTLAVGVDEPATWHTLKRFSGYVTPILIVPLLLVLVGAYRLDRIVQPSEAIETQLRRAAVAAALSESSLHVIPGRSAAAQGWNRLVGWLSEPRHVTTHERLAEVVQTRRQERTAEILHSLPDGVVLTDAEGRLTFLNHTATAWLHEEGPANQLVGRRLSEFLAFPEEEEALWQPELRSRTVIFEIKRLHGESEQVLRIARFPLRSDANGNNHVWSLRDVTQQKLADSMRDQFLNSATHELRTPLANIKAYAETLALTEVLDVDNQKEFCNIINGEATRLARFIDDLLSISSMEVGSLLLVRQDVDLERLFREAILKVRPQMEQKRLSFESLLPEKYPRLRLDKDKFVVALINILGNAAKYTPEEGRVALKVKCVDRVLRIDVEDTGVGIAADELPHIWEKFYRSKDSAVQQQSGTGLGLSLAQEIVRLHGGEITVKSEPGKGSTFTITLPLG